MPTPTDNHEYDVYEVGESAPWTHGPTIEALDIDVEIRDTDANKSNYAPKSGSKYLATDTGQIYLGDGSTWNPKWDLGAIGSGTDGTTGMFEALQSGYIFGHSPQYSIVVDPSDHTTDVAAIQHANDQLVANMATGASYAYLYIPSARPDGTDWTIGSTVTIGDISVWENVILRGWGFGGEHGHKIQVTINDGSPAFHIVGNPSGQPTKHNSTWFGGLAAHANGNDAEFIRLSDVTAFSLVHCLAMGFDGGNAAGAYVFDGATWNSWINRCNYVGDSAGVTNANAYAVVNDTLNGPPGELYFGPICSTYSDPADPFNTGLRVTTNASNICWGGRLEGTGGEAGIYQTGGHLFLTNYAEIGRLENTIPAVDFSGFGFNAAPGVSFIGRKGGDGYVINATRGQIGVPHSTSEMIGDTISIPSSPSTSHRLIVPYENAVNGTVSYPVDQWSGLTYPDGWQKWRAGTTTVAANSTTQIEAWAGSSSMESRLTNLVFNTAPTGDTRYQIVRGYDSTNGRHWVGIEETGGVGFDLDWEVHVRR